MFFRFRLLMLSSFCYFFFLHPSFASTTLKHFDLSGRHIACAVVDLDTAPGRVACWGRNNFPVFLDGSFQKAFVPILLPSFQAEVTQVVTGSEHICALLVGGEVQCWGNNQYGQLGLGHRVPAYAPVSVNLPSSVVKLFSGPQNTCAQLQNGELYCWGDNFSGQLGLGHNEEVDVPTLLPFSNIKHITFNLSHSCLISGTGSVFCAGSNANLKLGTDSVTSSNVFLDTGVSNALQVDVSASHSCASISTGEVKCWGGGGNGQLGNGSSPASSLPVVVSNVSDAVDVAVGALSSCALLSSGEVSCWGGNNILQLGSEGASSNVPRAVPNLDNVINISSGDVETCAQKNDGTLVCWGRGSYGLLGDGGSAQPHLQATVDFSFTKGYRSFQSIYMAPTSTFGLFADGTVRASGSNGGRILGLGTGYASSNSSISLFMEAIALAASSKIHVGFGHACSTKLNGAVECWGQNYGGQTGDNSGVSPTIFPFEVYPSGRVQKMQALYDSNCALLTDGTVECWGMNDFGQLGDGGIVQATSTPQAVSGLSNVKDLHCSKFSSFCCATVSDGSKKCWGYNDIGQFGFEPSRGFEPTPVAVNWGAGSISVTMGYYHTCFVNNDGQVYCVGGNFTGALGNGTRTHSTKPVLVQLPAPAIEVKAGIAHTCALLQDSRLFCWGENRNYNIGVGVSPRNVLRPVQVIEDIIDFDLGSGSTCALDSKRTLWCWGNNTSGNFGSLTPGMYPFPVPNSYK